METKFEIGDVVRYVSRVESWDSELTLYETYLVSHFSEVDRFLGLAGIRHSFTFNPDRFELVRRASAQREGGLAVGQRVRLAGYAPHIDGQVTTVLAIVDGVAELAAVPNAPAKTGWLVRFCYLEPADSAPAQPEAPPQPAPMTRAARVLAKMEQDPYEQARNEVEARIGLDTQNHLDHYTATATDNEPKQQAARLRMERMDVDRPMAMDRRSVLELRHPRDNWSLRRGGIRGLR